LLVIGLHGRGGKHDDFMRVMTSAGYLSGAILITPQAPTNAQWAAGDLPNVASLIDEVSGRYRTHRTVAFGYSMGAYFSFGLGLQHPDKVDAVIAHSGGLVVPVPDSDAVKKVPYFVIHGDADGTVPVSASRDAVKALKAGGIKRVEYLELPGHPHQLSASASQKGFEWVQQSLGPVRAPLSAKDAAAHLDALADAVKAKDFDQAVQSFDALRGVPGNMMGKVASAAKKHIASKDESLAVAAADAAGSLGEAGLAALKKGLKSKLEPVVVASAEALGRVGGDGALGLLLSALKSVERKKDRDDSVAAIHEALTQITGETQDDYKAWRRWIASR
jgi:predicted esterase